MYFITLGSQKFQFNRLLQKVDELVESGEIKEPVFAQSGYCDYTPKHFEFKAFLSKEEFEDIINQCRIVITHGGTGAIVVASKAEKKIIAVPRLAKYGEHVDDHQKEIIETFQEKGYVYGCEVEELGIAIKKIDEVTLKPFVSNTNHFIETLDHIIQAI